MKTRPHEAAYLDGTGLCMVGGGLWELKLVLT